MTGTLLQKIEAIRTLVNVKHYPDGLSALAYKLLWAHGELGEAIDEYMKTPSFSEPDIDKIYVEIIDIAFYILDFIGIIQRDTDHELSGIWDVPFAGLDTDEYSGMTFEQSFITIQRKLSRATDLYKKGEPLSEIELVLYDCLRVIAIIPNTDAIFDKKMEFNMQRPPLKIVHRDIEISIEQLIEDNPDAILYRDLDSAYVGYIERVNEPTRACYSYTKIISQLMGEGMSEIDAMDYFGVNIAGNWVGEHTPFMLYDHSI